MAILLVSRWFDVRRWKISKTSLLLRYEFALTNGSFQTERVFYLKNIVAYGCWVVPRVPSCQNSLTFQNQNLRSIQQCCCYIRRIIMCCDNGCRVLRRKESFFETKPRLVRRHTVLLRDGPDNSSASAASFSEIQSVSVVGKGYDGCADDTQPASGLGTQPSKIFREKRRLMKGIINKCLWFLWSVVSCLHKKFSCLRQRWLLQCRPSGRFKPE